MHSFVFDFTIISLNWPGKIFYRTRFTEQIITEHIRPDASGVLDCLLELSLDIAKLVMSSNSAYLRRASLYWKPRQKTTGDFLGPLYITRYLHTEVSRILETYACAVAWYYVIYRTLRQLIPLLEDQETITLHTIRGVQYCGIVRI